MIYVLGAAFIAAYLLFLRLFQWYRRQNRRNRLSQYLSRTSQARRRWTIDLNQPS
jgi:hypothetical protein